RTPIRRSSWSREPEGNPGRRSTSEPGVVGGGVIVGWISPILAGESMFTFKINEFQNAYGRWSSARSGFSTLPPLARMILFVLALPGIALGALSLLLFIVS